MEGPALWNYPTAFTSIFLIVYGSKKTELLRNFVFCFGLVLGVFLFHSEIYFSLNWSQIGLINTFLGKTSKNSN